MSRLDNISVAMHDRGLRDRVVAGAAFLKLPDPEVWVERHLHSLIGEDLGTGTDALADLHVAGVAAAQAAYAAVVTDDDVNGAIQQRLDFIGEPLPAPAGGAGV